MSTIADDSIFGIVDIDENWNFLQEQAKARARKTAGAIVEASVKKDYWLIKTKNQGLINGFNAQRKKNLSLSNEKLDDVLQGKTGDTAKEKINQIIKEDYYTDGVDTIHS